MRIEEYLKDREFSGMTIFGGTLSNGRSFALYADLIGPADRYAFSAESDDIRVVSSFSPESILNGCKSGKGLFVAIEEASDCIALSERLVSGEYEIAVKCKDERVSWSYVNTPGFGHIADSANGLSEPEVIAIGDSASSFIECFYNSLKDRYRVYICALYDGAVRIIDDSDRPL